MIYVLMINGNKWKQFESKEKLASFVVGQTETGYVQVECGDNQRNMHADELVTYFDDFNSVKITNLELCERGDDFAELAMIEVAV